MGWVFFDFRFKMKWFRVEGGKRLYADWSCSSVSLNTNYLESGIGGDRPVTPKYEKDLGGFRKSQFWAFFDFPFKMKLFRVGGGKRLDVDWSCNSVSLDTNYLKKGIGEIAQLPRNAEIFLGNFVNPMCLVFFGFLAKMKSFRVEGGKRLFVNWTCNSVRLETIYLKKGVRGDRSVTQKCGEDLGGFRKSHEVNFLWFSFQNEMISGGGRKAVLCRLKLGKCQACPDVLSLSGYDYSAAKIISNFLGFSSEMKWFWMDDGKRFYADWRWNNISLDMKYLQRGWGISLSYPGIRNGCGRNSPVPWASTFLHIPFQMKLFWMDDGERFCVDWSCNSVSLDTNYLKRGFGGDRPVTLKCGKDLGGFRKSHGLRFLWFSFQNEMISGGGRKADLCRLRMGKCQACPDVLSLSGYDYSAANSYIKLNGVYTMTKKRQDSRPIYKSPNEGGMFLFYHTARNTNYWTIGSNYNASMGWFFGLDSAECPDQVRVWSQSNNYDGEYRDLDKVSIRKVRSLSFMMRPIDSAIED